MRASRGFTLIELMVALVLSGIVALLAYGTLQAGLVSRARLDRYRRDAESVAALRAFLVDALRHPADGGETGYPAFTLRLSTNTAGLNAGGIQFVSRGVSSPLGSGPRWLVTVMPGNDGLHLSAEPLDQTQLGRIAAVVPAISGMRVQVIGDATQPEWRDEWSSQRQVPAAVRIKFTGTRGVPAGAPLVVESSLESAGR